MVDTAYRDSVERWRAGRLERLISPEGWLSLVGLWWLHDGSNTVGSSSDSDVVLPTAVAAPLVGRIVVVSSGQGGHGGAAQVVLQAEPDGGLLFQGKPFETLALGEGAHDAPPTRVRVGSVSFHLIRREDQLAVRVRDRDAPARRRFVGIGHYPVDERWRIRARFDPVTEAREVVVPAAAGPGERYDVPGTVEFETPNAPGALHRLTAFLEAPDEDLFFVFGDATNRGETYGGGRFLYTPQPDGDGSVDLDFNRAYNPPCVFTPHATCPLPLPENRLGVRIEAGELAYAGDSTERSDEPNP
jgi:uncharacterized protein (DUF1684 family)